MLPVHQGPRERGGKELSQRTGCRKESVQGTQVHVGWNRGGNPDRLTASSLRFLILTKTDRYLIAEEQG